MNLQIQSVQSLRLTTLVAASHLSEGTGFVVQASGRPVLVTNWHVVSGRSPVNGSPLSPTGGIPEYLSIWHHAKDSQGLWYRTIEPLYDANGNPLWKEHPLLGSRADIVALPITQFQNRSGKSIDLYPHDIHACESIRVSPGEPVSVVGYPFGFTAEGPMGKGQIAIWATGFVATDLDVNWNDLPVFLIDCRGRPGQSGSPVLARRTQGFIDAQTGAHRLDVGGTRFMGVYSGRINDQSDLGMVWKVSALAEILARC